MGEANNRGTHAERREQFLERELDTAEVLLFLHADNGRLRMATLPRDEAPKLLGPDGRVL